MRRAFYLIFPLLFAAGHAIAAGRAIAEDDPAKYPFPVVAVDGEASEEVRPDKAEISFSVIEDSPTAAEAASDLAKRSESLIRQIKSFGVSSKDIATRHLTVSPVYFEERDPKTNRIISSNLTGYQGSIQIYINTKDVDGAGAIVTRLITSTDVDQLNGLSFSVERRDERETALLAKAVAIATKKAQLIAEAASMKLGPLVRIGTPSIRIW